MNFFDENGCLKRGKQKLLFYFGIQGDGNVIPSQNRTPGELHDHYSKWDYKFKMEKYFEAYKSNLSALHASKQENKNEWLDRLMLSRIQESIGSAALADNSSGLANGWGCPMEELDLNSFCFLVVEMPLLQHPVRVLHYQLALV